MYPIYLIYSISPIYLPPSPMLRIQTLGGFRVWIDDGGIPAEIPPTAWTREKALHLLHLLITLRRKKPHKEQIVDTLWPDLDPETGDRDFRVALNALQNALEPTRAPRTPSQYVIRSELNYSLNLAEIWLDVDEFEKHLALANNSDHGSRLSGGGALPHNAQAKSKPAGDNETAHLQSAIALYHGEYLPERRYDDWTSAERERLHTLALSAMTRLAEILLPTNPLETLRLTRRVLELDPLWENAYRIEMQAHLSTGNRPMAIRMYEKCKKVMMEEFGLEPLPETRQIYKKILGN
ncbi:MAG: transcriptional regulator [Anaerolineales bacterium]|nr:transcriptional regulator [Anaerolineales bacterium]